MSTGIDVRPQYAPEQLALLGIPSSLAGPLNAYLAALNDNDAAYPGQQHGGRYKVFDLDPNATSAGKFIRVVSIYGGRVDSVHSFIEKATGRVAKPGGWAGPAKSTAKATKGQILSHWNLSDPDSVARLLDRLRSDPLAWAGGYLYAARAR